MVKGYEKELENKRLIVQQISRDSLDRTTGLYLNSCWIHEPFLDIHDFNLVLNVPKHFFQTFQELKKAKTG